MLTNCFKNTRYYHRLLRSMQEHYYTFLKLGTLNSEQTISNISLKSIHRLYWKRLDLFFVDFKPWKLFSF